MKQGTANREPVAITGVGIVSALGIGGEEWLAAAAEAEPAFATLSAAETGGSPCRAAPMHGYDVAPLLETRKTYLDRHTALLLGAMALALRDAGWAGKPLPGVRAGLMVGSAWGGLGTMAAFFRDVLLKSAKFAKPILFPHAYANTAAAMTAIEWAIQGPHEHFAGGRMASAQALTAALDTLRAGEADVVFAGGCEALSPALFRVLQAQGRLPAADGADEPLRAPVGIPYAPGGSGIVPGEGAAILVLETLAAARRRGATVLATLAGAGLSGTGLDHACARALEEADLPRDRLAGILAPGTGQVAGDRAEEAALQRLLAACPVPVTALAGLQGDCLGAAPALDAAAAVLLRQAGFLPSIPGLAPSGEQALRYVLGKTLSLPEEAALLVATADASDFAAFVIA